MLLCRVVTACLNCVSFCPQPHTFGMQVVWCVACKRAVVWSLLAASQSPATLFQLLYPFEPW